MILRNLEHPEVKASRYRAHGGGTAHMLLTARGLLKGQLRASALRWLGCGANKLRLA